MADEFPALAKQHKAGEPMTHDEQLARWVAGDPVHNTARNECCPDFSCCRPELLADEKTRKAFAGADEPTRMSMLGMFLGHAISTYDPDAKVHIAGDVPEGEPS